APRVRPISRGIAGLWSVWTGAPAPPRIEQVFDSPIFVHLDVRTCFSLKEGAFTPEQLARRAAELGTPAVAMTDRDGLYGAARFVQACEREGVTPLLGASLTVRADVEGGRAPSAASSRRRAKRSRPSSEERGPTAVESNHRPDAHVILLATDDTGYANLCRLITDAHMMAERGDPSVAESQICAHASGLVALVGPRSHAGRLAVRGRVDAGASAVEPFREAFAERLFVAVEHRVERRSADEVRAMLRLAER